MPFMDRSDAGRRLAAALEHYKGRPTAVLALPRGGVPVAAEVARALAAPIDLILVRKIGAPRQPELAIGAVVDGLPPITVRNEDIIAHIGVSERAFNAIRDQELAEIERRRRFYLGDRRRAEIAGHIAIVIDDGIATGATMRAALRALRLRKPERLVLAVPVAPVGTIEALAQEADEVVCLEIPHDFHAIGYFYEDFHQVSDEEVIAILARFPVMPGVSSGQVDLT